MAKHYSARVVEEACQLLSAAASNVDIVTDDIGRASLDAPPASWALTREAMKVAILAMGAPWSYDRNNEAQFWQHRMVCAEAEALLRCGWRPS